MSVAVAVVPLVGTERPGQVRRLQDETWWTWISIYDVAAVVVVLVSDDKDTVVVVVEQKQVEIGSAAPCRH